MNGCVGSVLWAWGLLHEIMNFLFDSELNDKYYKAIYIQAITNEVEKLEWIWFEFVDAPKDHYSLVVLGMESNYVNSCPKMLLCYCC